MEHKEKMTDYEWLTEMNLCHRCRKEKPAPGRKFCFTCLDKIREENAGRYDPEAAKSYQRRRREIYRSKKAAGICVRCNEKATHGMYCLECSIKVKKYNAKTAERRRMARHERGLVPETRVQNGLCIRCGGDLSSSEKTQEIIMCRSCREKAGEYGKKGAKNSYFRKLGRERYNKKSEVGK